MLLNALLFLHSAKSIENVNQLVNFDSIINKELLFICEEGLE